MPKTRVDQYERASKAWPILTDCARNRQTTTYGQLAERMGAHPRVCRFFLGLIQDYCFNYNLPPLQSLVVNKHTRLPGEGYIATARDYRQIERAHNTVFNYSWDTIRNPF
jgi:putative restriction endonuclease